MFGFKPGAEAAIEGLLDGLNAQPKRPRKVVVPTVVGLTAYDAQVELAKAGLSWRFEERLQPPATTMGIVVDQSPAAGTKVKRRQTVVILGVEHRPAP